MINECRYLIRSSAEEQIKWRCELTQIFIEGIEDFPTFRNELMEQTGYYISKTKNNKMMEVKEAVSFETIFDKIFVLKQTMEYLKNNYFIYFSNDQKIFNYNDKGDNIMVTCSKDEISKLKRLNFFLVKKLLYHYHLQKFLFVEIQINVNLQFSIILIIMNLFLVCLYLNYIILFLIIIQEI